MIKKTKLADGSISSEDRLNAAAVRAIDAHMTLGRLADRLCDELDQVTSPGVVRTPITEDDSLVIAIRDISSGRDT